MIETLKGRLKGKTAVVCVGNPLRGDDAAGCEIARLLPGIPYIFDTEETPENYIGKIKSAKPDTICVVDAVQFSCNAGDIGIFEIGDISNSSVSTHNLPLSFFMFILKNETGADVFLLGIQPASIKLGENLSNPVKKAVEEIVGVIRDYRF